MRTKTQLCRITNRAVFDIMVPPPDPNAWMRESHPGIVLPVGLRDPVPVRPGPPTESISPRRTETTINGGGKQGASDLLTIATLVLDGEIAAKTNNYDVAIVKLRAAVRHEDGLKYDEPPDWIQPRRHTLGAVLLRAGRPAEAEAVYREDMQKNPENGWALMGLRNALLMQGQEAEAAKADARFHKAWAHADVSPKFTCYCQASQ